MATVPTKSITDITKAKPLTPEFRKPTVPAAAFGGAVAEQEALAARSAGESARLMGQSAAAEAQAFGKIGVAVANAGEKVFDMALKKKKQDEDREVNNAMIKLGDGSRNLLWGPDGAMTKKGDEAIPALRAAQNAIRELEEEIFYNLSSGRAQDSFRAASGLRLNATFVEMGRHAITQKIYAEEITAQARLMDIGRSVGLSGDRGVLKDAEVEIRRIIRKLYSGYDEKTQESYANQELGKLYVTWVEGLLKRGQGLTAKAVVNRVGPWWDRPELELRAEVDLKNLIKASSLQDEARIRASKIINTIEKKLPTEKRMIEYSEGRYDIHLEKEKRISRAKQFKMAREIEDRALSDAVIHRLKIRHEEQRQQEIDNKNEIFALIYGLVEQGFNEEEIIKRHPKIMNDFRMYRGALADMRDRILKLSKKEQFAARDNVKLLDLWLNPDKFDIGGLTVSEMSLHMTEPTVKYLIKLKEQARRAKKRKLSEVDSSINKMVNALSKIKVMATSGRAKEKTKNFLNPVQINLIRGRLLVYAADFVKENKGRPPNEKQLTEEKQKILMDLLAVANPPGPWNAFNKPMVLMSDADEGMTSEQLDVARVDKEHIPHTVYTKMVDYVRVRKKDMKLKVPVELIEMLVAAWGYRDAGRMEELIRNFRTLEEKKDIMKHKGMLLKATSPK